MSRIVWRINRLLLDMLGNRRVVVVTEPHFADQYPERVIESDGAFRYWLAPLILKTTDMQCFSVVIDKGGYMNRMLELTPLQALHDRTYIFSDDAWAILKLLIP